MRDVLQRLTYWHSETTSLSQHSPALANYGPRDIKIHRNHVPRIIAGHQRKQPRTLTLAATAGPRNPLAAQQPIYWHGLPSAHFLLRASNAQVSGALRVVPAAQRCRRHAQQVRSAKRPSELSERLEHLVRHHHLPDKGNGYYLASRGGWPTRSDRVWLARTTVRRHLRQAYYRSLCLGLRR